MNKTAANKMIVTAISANGNNHSKLVEYGSGRRDWTQAMKDFGVWLTKTCNVNPENVLKVVVINGTDVFVYEGNEPAEVLGFN